VTRSVASQRINIKIKIKKNKIKNKNLKKNERSFAVGDFVIGSAKKYDSAHDY